MSIRITLFSLFMVAMPQVLSADIGIVTGGERSGSDQAANLVRDFVIRNDALPENNVEKVNAVSFVDVIEARERLARKEVARIINVSFDGRLDEITGDDALFAQFGHSQPFENISKFKRMNGDNNRADWVGLGWILQSNFDPIGEEESDCDPQSAWRNNECAFKSGNGDEFTIRVRLGHKGWPVYGVLGFVPSSEEHMHALIDTLASENWSELARDYFFVVPDDAVRSRRDITFELWDFSNFDDPIATVAGEEAIPSFLIPRSNRTGTRNSCGGLGVACPEFNVPDRVITDLVERNRQLGLIE